MISTKRASRLIGCNLRVLQRWIHAGRFDTSEKNPATGRYRLAESEVEHVAKYGWDEKATLD